jgi:hypothetical protein
LQRWVHTSDHADEKEQIVSLEMQFPKSPRVAILLGLRFEALGEVGKAKKVYQELLDKDETNIVCH